MDIKFYINKNFSETNCWKLRLEFGEIIYIGKGSDGIYLSSLDDNIQLHSQLALFSDIAPNFFLFSLFFFLVVFLLSLNLYRLAFLFAKPKKQEQGACYQKC